MPSISPSRPAPQPTTTASVDEEQHAAFDGQLCEHAQRPGWGLAIRVWTRRDLRGYQFEDGQLRTIAEPFEHMMRPVTRPADETARLHEELWKLSGLAQARNERRRGAGGRSTCSVSFDEQVALFLVDFPEGFTDPAWLRDMRGAGTGRKSTRHREPAVGLAHSLLGADALAPLMREEEHGLIIARAQKILEACSLVSTSQRAPLTNLLPAKQRAFAVALHEWLHGAEPRERPFGRLVSSLEGPKRPPSWPLITAFAALVHPADHICIKPSVFVQQAKVLAPGLTLGSRPSHTEYELMNGLAATITEELHSRKLTPKDRLDVHDFIWATIRPAAVTRIESTRSAAPAA